jgi:hypothetical protein
MMIGNILLDAVGPRQANRELDVRTVQRLLHQHGMVRVRFSNDGSFDSATAAAILDYQRRIMRQRFATGVIRPGDETFWRLSQTTPLHLLAGALGGILFLPLMGPDSFSDQDFIDIAKALECEVAAVKAVQFVESGKLPYDKKGRPTILFERHLFSQFTFRRYDAHFPAISNPAPGGYSWPELDQYVRLQHAYALDPIPALRATSWGGFQILGDNFHEAGCDSVGAFIRAVCGSIQQQKDTFVHFVKSNHARLVALQKKDWAQFALHYNGKHFKINHYDTQLAKAYARFS